MKIYFKNFVLFVLIFALLLISGCGEDNSAFDSSLLSGGSSSLYAESSVKDESKDQSAESSKIPQKNSDKNSAESKNQSSLKTSSKTDLKLPEVIAKTGFKGLWVSYYEFPFWGKTEQEAAREFGAMMRKVAKQGYTAVFCHVRANADAFYPSKYFPYAMQLTGKPGGDPGYDPLKIMIWAAKKNGLEFHAWINPYRVSNITTNPDELAAGHIAAEWLTDGSNRAIKHGKGIYFNPGSTDVQQLILNGIREILEKYDVDGIHFDDYFYPENVSKSFDAKQYNAYRSQTARPLSLANWRRTNVNALVSAVYRLCHSENVVFGISPAANMSLDNSHDNYNLLYADIALWMRKEGYVDYILPQLYFGYRHPVKKSRYKYLLSIWAKLPKHKNLKFYVGLGAYRMDENCDDEAEWHYESDLMARQTVDAMLKGADGIAVFSYTSSTSNKPHNALQIKNMFEVFK